MTEEAKSNLYDLPRIYHAAFPELEPAERAMINHVFSTHSPFPVVSILEPACGTGRALVDLASFGYQITGYDLSTAMVAFANDRIGRAGLEKLARAIPGAMATTKVEGTFDSAINLINSLGYLVSDADVVSHFRNTAACLRMGGLYLVYLGLTRENSVAGEKTSWSSQADGMLVTTTWGSVEVNRSSKVCTDFSSIEVIDGNNRFVIDERHIMRMWLLEDLRGLAEAGSFQLEAVYDEKGNRMENDQYISEFSGNLYFVFRSI